MKNLFKIAILFGVPILLMFGWLLHISYVYKYGLTTVLELVGIIIPPIGGVLGFFYW
jgi:hypothetical protein